MPECTRTSKRFAQTPALPLAAALILAFGCFTTEAHADGDPASDVLATQTLFLPQDAGVPQVQQARLQTLLTEAGRDGFRVRVAVIASASDLGSVTELWREPQTYSRFLGQELALVYKGPLLVAMPNGFGVYGVGGGRVPGASSVRGSPGRGLGSATISAVQRLAAADGRALALPSATTAFPSSSADALPWLVFALGALLIAAAWTASVRARPLGGARDRPGTS